MGVVDTTLQKDELVMPSNPNNCTYTDDALAPYVTPGYRIYVSNCLRHACYVQGPMLGYSSV